MVIDCFTNETILHEYELDNLKTENCAALVYSTLPPNIQFDRSVRLGYLRHFAYTVTAYRLELDNAESAEIAR